MGLQANLLGIGGVETPPRETKRCMLFGPSELDQDKEPYCFLGHGRVTDVSLLHCVLYYSLLFSIFSVSYPSDFPLLPKNHYLIITPGLKMQLQHANTSQGHNMWLCKFILAYPQTLE